MLKGTPYQPVIIRERYPWEIEFNSCTAANTVTTWLRDKGYLVNTDGRIVMTNAPKQQITIALSLKSLPARWSRLIP